jgi:hypothetical protein
MSLYLLHFTCVLRVISYILHELLGALLLHGILTSFMVSLTFKGYLDFPFQTEPWIMKMRHGFYYVTQKS